METILELQDLKKHFLVGSKGLFNKKHWYLHAVDGLNLKIEKGEILGLVGESGCGKSTTGRTVLRLYEPNSGKIFFKGKEITSLNEKEMWPYRKHMQMIFQDPYASLNPRMTVTDIIGEGITTHQLAKGKEAQERIFHYLDKVGLKKEHASRYPHEFSGGQRQRIGVARALAVEPEFVVCDEPISALDVSIQAQLVNMLEDLQEDMGLTYLFIAHDLSMVKHISNRIGVMYLGKLVELAPSNELYSTPLSPYTQSLLSAVPIADPDKAAQKERIIPKGDVPSPIDPAPGCRFANRCPFSSAECRESDPELRELRPNHFVACHKAK